MDSNIFKTQIARLEREWKYAFGDEKKKLIWEALAEFEDEFMVDACNEFLSNRRSPPVLNDFYSYKDDFNRRKAFSRSLKDTDFQTYLRNRVNSATNPEFARLCCELVDQRMGGKITLKQLFEATYELERSVKKNHTCNKCDDSGIIFASKDKYEYTFSCDCSTGKRISNLPVWDMASSKIYKIASRRVFE